MSTPRTWCTSTVVVAGGMQNWMYDIVMLVTVLYICGSPPVNTKNMVYKSLSLKMYVANTVSLMSVFGSPAVNTKSKWMNVCEDVYGKHS